MPVDEFFDESVNEETVGEGSKFDLIASGYHVLRVADVTEKDDSIEVDVEVRPGGTKPGEISKVHREFFSLNSKDMNRKRRTAFAIATGLTTREQIKEARESGQGLTIDYNVAIGRQFVAELEQTAKQKQDGEGNWVDTDKMVCKIPYDNIWHLDSKQAAKYIDRSKIEDTSDPFGSDRKPTAEIAAPDLF